MWLLSISQMQCKARQIQFSRRTNPKTPQKKSGSLIRANSRSCKSCLKCSGWISRLPGDPPCPWTSRRVRASRACTSGVDRWIYIKKIETKWKQKSKFCRLTWGAMALRLWLRRGRPTATWWSSHRLCGRRFTPVFSPTIVILVINLTLQWARQRWPWKWKFVKSSLQFHWF